MKSAFPGGVDVADAEGLIEATRGLMHAAATTAIEPGRVRELTARIHEISEELQTRRRDRVLRIPYQASMADTVRSGMPWRMFPFNPFGYPLEICISGGEARAELIPGALQEGPPGWLHGGFAAAFLDALLGVLVMVEVAPCFTARLELDFLAGTVLDEPIVVGGKVVESAGRKIIVDGWINQHGQHTVRARGVFVRMPQPATTASEEE